MQLVVAVIRPEKLAAVQQALLDSDIEHFTVSNAFGCGRETGPTYIYRSTTVRDNLQPRVRLEVALDEELVVTAVSAIQRAARTGSSGDGTIWVCPIAQNVHIRYSGDGHRLRFAR